MNPFLTVHGPRPAAWWATCDLCGKTSSPRFQSETAAAEWEHDCRTEIDDDGTVTLTIVVSVDDPPKINWDGHLSQARSTEAKCALADMGVWTHATFLREDHPHWSDFVAAEWAKRRKRQAAAALAGLEEDLQRPFPCPACRRRCKSVRGLKAHMRSCRRIDRAKLAAGEYDDAMVPGGRPEPTP